MTIPEIDKILIKVPLYEPIKFSDIDDLGRIYELLFFHGRIDAFCPTCAMYSTFKGVQEYPTPLGHYAPTLLDYNNYSAIKFTTFINKIHQVNLVCTREESHLMQISFLIADSHIKKIGQYPSIADMTLPDYKKYRKLLGDEKSRELTKGLGLISHGIGIGAYVYLRRIFEGLIEEAHIKHAAFEGWDEGAYKEARMPEKIDLLESELPTFLVKNRKLYSIMSKGIHELSESECLEYFPTVKLAVELILDEKLEQIRKEKKIEEAAKSINKLLGDLGTK